MGRVIQDVDREEREVLVVEPDRILLRSSVARTVKFCLCWRTCTSIVVRPLTSPRRPFHHRRYQRFFSRRIVDDGESCSATGMAPCFMESGKHYPLRFPSRQAVGRCARHTTFRISHRHTLICGFPTALRLRFHLLERRLIRVGAAVKPLN